MDIQFYGANCVTLTYQGVRMVVDDNLTELGAKSITRAGDVALFTGAHATPAVETKLIIDGPGEYEVSAFSVFGIPARAHIDEPGHFDTTMYRLVAGDIRILVTGHVYPEFSESQLEKIGTIDVVIIPVGGNGYTLDPAGALGIIKEIEPRLVIPTHFDDSSLNFPVPQQTLDQAIKTLGVEPSPAVNKLKLKPSELTDVLRVAILDRS
jgi:L-ascorbate metabolism protein UlaG (beta-lactamase superfamily)